MSACPEKTYPIQGIPYTPDPQGTLPARQELSRWSTSSDPEERRQVSLFIRALDELQRRNPIENQFSYFRLAGIHGAPGQGWDQAPDPQEEFKGTKGYCYHNSYLFPTWHRPYMVLYEQCLHEIMEEKVQSISDVAVRKEWEEAARNWRLPFWDWAVEQEDTRKLGLPTVASSAQISILRLDGSGEEQSFANPLLKFTNWAPDANGTLVETPMGDQRMGKFKIQFIGEKPPNKHRLDFSKPKATSRWANDQVDAEWVNGYALNDLVGEAISQHRYMGENQPNLTVKAVVSRLLSPQYFSSYLPFSSSKWAESHPTDYLSLEMIHNNIHEWTGGSGVRSDGTFTQGHMANVPVSSFDPIFWMHHWFSSLLLNVDRLLALFQYINSAWLEDEDLLQTPLQPFHRDEDKTVWTSQEAEEWERLGYTYPELVGRPDPQQVSRNVQAKYGTPVKALQPSWQGLASCPGVNDDEFQDYIINVKYDRYALDGYPYKIKFFLHVDDQNDIPLGEVYNFSTPLDLGCGNCSTQKAQGVLSKAQVPITLHLHELVRERYSGIPSLRSFSYTPDEEPGLQPNFISNFLEGALIWTVTTNTGELVDLTQFSGLEVNVLTARASFDDRNVALYQPKGYETLYQPTQGKPCGAAPK
ncbi:hypothetical protein N7478_010107 [Penicillium angulare]|uniref:uncharacterized protein n=1 Tax=Penicillium angulare TaxID=116970 RepID=UPI00253FDB58|nr:uncharacterized protein N7478_010107 [Penicillium angulare]KAJ5267299.1 hypothetical protein N7478_010107 [Penicillium angulare]